MPIWKVMQSVQRLFFSRAGEAPLLYPSLLYNPLLAGDDPKVAKATPAKAVI
jgi:hypothetical protein